MLKLTPGPMSQVILELWRIFGRAKVYRNDWSIGLMTPIYEKGDKGLAQNYRPLCMLSVVRKLLEAAITRRITRDVQINPRQFGFQRGLSSLKTLVDVNAQVKVCLEKIATLDLSNAYDKVNHFLLWKNCRELLDRNICNILKAFLQALKITTKGDVTGTKIVQKLVLTQGSPLSLVLFLVYINKITHFCPRPSPSSVITDSIREAGITITADDIALHTRDWPTLQKWLKVFSRWACKNNMLWKSTKFTIDIDRWNLRFYIGGGKIRKVMEATYLVMALKSTGFTQKMKIERIEAAITISQATARATILDTDSPRDSTNYAL